VSEDSGAEPLNLSILDEALKRIREAGGQPQWLIFIDLEALDFFRRLIEVQHSPALGQITSDECSEAFCCGEQPTVEQREKYYQTEHNRDWYETTIFDMLLPEHFEYVPIPESIYKIGARSAWLNPTPSEVERVFEVLSECWKYIKSFGKMPFYKEPENMDDKQVDRLLKALNEELNDQYIGWGSEAGFKGPTQFSLELPIEDKRTIAAMIQKVFYEQHIHEKLRQLEWSEN